MLALQTSVPLCFLFSTSAVVLLLIYSPGQRAGDHWRHRRDELEPTALRPEEQQRQTDDHDSTEFPAEHIDPAAIDLTPLVNTLINSSQSGSHQLFSLLSVTSYSSLALHKLTLLVYNISSIKNIESSMFRRRFCYCVTNETNDLTDFTAILLDVMGNSTSYLHELFKSASILSVSQKNNSDCIFICVMAGQMGRDRPDLWDLDSITPLFNQTIVEGPHTVGNMSAARVPVEWQALSTNRSHMSPSVSRVHSTAHVSPSSVAETSKEDIIMTARIPSTAPGPITPPLASPAKRSPTTSASRYSVTTPVPTSTTTKYESTSATASVTPSAAGSLPVFLTASIPTTVAPKASESSLRLMSTTTPPQFSASSKDTAAVSSVQMFLTTRTPPSGSATPPAISQSQQFTTAMRETATSSTTVPTTRTMTIHTQRTTNPPRGTTTPTKTVTTERPGCPWRRPELGVSSAMISTHKLQPCVFELCKFFSQCLCRPFGFKKRMKRYCADSHLWYQKHTLEVCRRVRRLSFSRNLKQRCLSKMCNKL